LHIRTSSYAVCAGVALVTGCADWPRFDHLPGDDGSLSSDVPPGSLVDVDWTELTEPDPDPGDLPHASGHPSATLHAGRGALLTGTLEGLGWSDEAVAETLTDDDCPGAEGRRSPLPQGDYLGDVDYLVVELPDAATLCAEVRLEVDHVGWDVIAWPIDACGIPGDPLQDATGGVLGADLGGAGGGFGAVVEAGRYAVTLAAYDPYDPEAELPYTLGVAAVPVGPDGRPGACPLLPTEAP